MQVTAGGLGAAVWKVRAEGRGAVGVPAAPRGAGPGSPRGSRGPDSSPETASVLSHFCLLAAGLFSKTDGQRSLSQAFRFRRVAVVRIRVNMKAD